MKDSPYNLTRFIEAQARNYTEACEELRQGQKQSHWIWYIFPQLVALGNSPTAKYYGIHNLEEAQAYMAHPILGPRLVDCVKLTLLHPNKNIKKMLGYPDYLKYRSCLTLFKQAAPEQTEFQQALVTFYHGQEDQRSKELLLPLS